MIDSTAVEGVRVADVSPIDSDRYVIKQKELLGKGSWGEIYQGRDTKLDQDVAIKVFAPTDIAKQQMEYRELNELTAMRKEAAELTSCSRIVPRKYEEDKNGKPFIVMPIFRDTLARRINGIEGNSTYRIGKGLSTKFAYDVMKDVATGLAESHKILKKTHQDLRPENILFQTWNEGDPAFLGDLGTGTCVSVFGNGNLSPRDNMGFIYTRAPESFKEGSHPHYAADVWGFGSLAYRLFTGKYVLEDELDNTRDPALFIEQLGIQAGNDIVFSKINNNIPRHWRGLFKDCLRFDWKRIQDGEKLSERFNYTLKTDGNWSAAYHNTLKYFKHASIATWSAGLLGLCIYAGLSDKAKVKDLPKFIETGPTMIGNPIRNPQVIFEQEKLEYVQHMAHIIGGEGLVRQSTKNPYVEHLTRSYLGAHGRDRGIVWGVGTPYQKALYMAKAGVGTDEKQLQDIEVQIQMINNAIEQSIPACKTPEGLIDLEDVCVASRLGIDVVNKAKAAAKNRHYTIYRNAVDEKGERIIPLKEVAFIEDWRGYINSR